LSKLISLNNKILCILQNKTYSAPVKELYADYNTVAIIAVVAVLTCYWSVYEI